MAALLVVPLMLIPCCGPAAAAEPEKSPPGASPSSTVVVDQQRCSSVVLRHCRLQYVPVQHLDGDDAHPAVDIPAHWEAIRNAAYDDDEIFIQGQSMRDPSVREVFRRYFGDAPGRRGFVTRSVGAGARCTTDTATGMRLCSKPGSEAPEPFIGTNFSDTVF
jgi:hypothetical protein